LIICIVGPTCSGKSKLAENLALYYHALIVNFDAFQVYKEMNIGTAKPTLEELATNNYYLYNIRRVNEPYDVAQYQKDCRKLLEKYYQYNIILVGGTGLYLKAALFDYKFEKEEPMPKDYLVDKTNEELFSTLLHIDPLDAHKIGIYNRKRLLRANFFYESHKQSKSELNKNGKDHLLYHNVEFIGLDISRELLYKNINTRVDLMFQNGLKEEVIELFKTYGSDERSLQAIGYKEFNIDLSDEERKELIKKNTRNYAKRQMTFFRHQFTDVKWFPSPKEAEEYAKNLK